MLHKLAAIQCGDIVEYQHEGQTLRGEVHGWRLCNNGYEHRAIVGSARHGSYEDEVSLRSIIARERLHGAGSGTVTF